MGFLIVPNLVPWLIVSFSGLIDRDRINRVATVLKVREKSGNFSKRQGKFLILLKSVKSQGILYSGFYFISFLQDFEIIFFWKDETYTAKQAKRTIWHSTPERCSSCGQWFLLWMLSSKFLLPLPAKSRKRLKMKRKLWMACKKGESECKHGLFLINKRSVKTV